MTRTIHTLDGRTIKTDHDYEWTAIEDDSYDGPGSPYGTGRTEGDAVLDLLEKLEERDDMNTKPLTEKTE